MSTYVHIHNIEGSSDDTPLSFKSWKEAYISLRKGKKKEVPQNCPGCGKRASLEGCHVWKAGDTETEYITLMCHECNCQPPSQPIDIDESLLEKKVDVVNYDIVDGGDFSRTFELPH